MQESATGISWYHRHQYDELRTVLVDGLTLPGTYDEWLASAEQVERQLHLTGNRVIRAYVDPIEFPEWCRSTGHKSDANGRMAFGTAIAAKTLSQEKKDSMKDTKTFIIPVEFREEAPGLK